MSLSFARSALAGLLTLSCAATALAAPSAFRQGRFRQLHQVQADVPALVVRLEDDLAAALALPGDEGAAYLFSAAQATLAEVPDMPGGFRALLSGAVAGALGLENPWRVRAVLAHSYSILTSAPEAYAVEGPAVFPRVLRAAMRRGHMPVLPHVDALHVLAGGFADLALQADLLPSPLVGTALEALVSATVSQAEGAAAAKLVLARGAATLYPEPEITGRLAFLRAGLGALDEYTPAALGRAVLARFAAMGAASEYLGEGDRAQLQAASLIAAGISDDAQAVQVLRAAMEGLAAFPGA